MNGGSVMQNNLLQFLQGLLHRFSDSVRTAVTGCVETTGRWELRGYHRDSLPPDWSDLPPEEKLATLDNLDPFFTTTTSNATSEDLHNLQARLLNPAEDPLGSLTTIAIGTDGSASSTTDSDLGDEVMTTDITESTVSRGTLIARGFVDTSEANNNNLREVGSKTDSDVLLNRGTIAEITKSNAIAVSIRVELTFTDGGSA